jgi:hypothetical protein
MPQISMSADVQMGPKYMKLCEELDLLPAQNLVPAIQLSIYAPALSLPGPKRVRLESEGLVKEDEEAAEGLLVPEDLALKVICNETTATLHPANCRVHVNGKEMTATQFEQYAGAGSAKKWKTSLRILPGQVPECPPGKTPSACSSGSSSNLSERSQYVTW